MTLIIKNLYLIFLIIILCSCKYNNNVFGVYVDDLGDTIILKKDSTFSYYHKIKSLVDYGKYEIDKNRLYFDFDNNIVNDSISIEEFVVDTIKNKIVIKFVNSIGDIDESLVSIRINSLDYNFWSCTGKITLIRNKNDSIKDLTKNYVFLYSIPENLTIKKLTLNISPYKNWDFSIKNSNSNLFIFTLYNSNLFIIDNSIEYFKNNIWSVKMKKIINKTEPNVFHKIVAN